MKNLVSCLLLTADRRKFVPEAIRRFLEQDYANRELLIIDDGISPVEDLVPADSRIRYFRLPRKNSVGAKRNIGCREARGEFIAHWDDDDWMASWRLSYQVEELSKFNADLCGLRQLYFWGPDPDQAWEYAYEAESQPWVAGGTMLYRRSLWEAQPFTDIDVGEDNAFVWSEVPKRILPLVDRRFYIASIHPGNTSPKIITADRWRPAPLDEVQQIIGDDWEPYLDLVFGTLAQPEQADPSDLEAPGRAAKESCEAVASFTFAKRDHLQLREFAAFNSGRDLPFMRRWELPFALFHSRLPETGAVLDCSINPASLDRWIAELYPHVLYRHSDPIQDRALAPVAAPDNAFDRVLCLNTLEHLCEKEREQIIRALAATLKDDGLLIITCDYYFDSSWESEQWLGTGLMRADRQEVFGGFNKLTPEDLSALCARHGLSAEAPIPAEPVERDRGLYLNAPPFEHAVYGAVFRKTTVPLPQGRRIVLSLLTWNTRSISLESLDANVKEARMLRRLGHDAHVFAVDNGSIDGTAEELRNALEFLDVPHRLVLNSENIGNSRARNQIIDYALEVEADYILFVDGDIEIVPFSSFAMMRYMESQGRRLGCLGAYSFMCTPKRAETTPFLPSLAGCQLQSSDALAWTQYGIFRCRMFRDGIRFEEDGPFGEPGHGLEDVDLAFQMNQKGYLNVYFAGMNYLHRNLSSSVGILTDHGLEPTERYYRRRDFVLRKWEGVKEISEGPLNWVRQARAPWNEARTGRTTPVRMGAATPPILVPGEVMEWVDRSVSDMMDRTELIGLAAVLASFDWRLSDLIVEIGAYIGTTTVMMAKITELLGTKPAILSIDPFERFQPDQLNPQGRYYEYLQNLRGNGIEDRCAALAAFSGDVARSVPDNVGVLVIDGSHHYDAVRKDMELYLPKVVPGGYVFMDDYGPSYPDVIRAVDEYLPQHPEFEVIVKSYYVILRRRPGFNLPKTGSTV